MFFLKKQKLLTNKKMLGKWGEKRCEKFLKNKGLTTLAKNYSCKVGEIDLVMADSDRTIVFVEVKTRASNLLAEPKDLINPDKQHRMHLAAQFFLAEHNIKSRPCRFDIVTIILDENFRPQINHLKNAFVI